MNKKILVTYASRTDSTSGVAEAIGRTLTEKGLQADVRPMKEVNDLTSYGAVVAGSPIQGAKWLPEAIQYIKNHRHALASKPFASFTLCMTLAMKNGEKYRHGVEQWLQPIRQIVQPVSEGFFAGILDISRIPSFDKRLQFRISVFLGIWKEGDHRDWNAINTWAENLNRILEK